MRYLRSYTNKLKNSNSLLRGWLTDGDLGYVIAGKDIESDVLGDCYELSGSISLFSRSLGYIKINKICEYIYTKITKIFVLNFDFHIKF